MMEHVCVQLSLTSPYSVSPSVLVTYCMNVLLVISRNRCVRWMDIAVIGMLLLQEIATIDRQDLFPQLGDG